MIRELRIRNLALIEHLSIDLDDGFVVVTGETGAGKSILAGAVGLLLGEKAGGDMLRSGASDGEVTGSFEIVHSASGLNSVLAENAIEPDDGMIIIRRTFSRRGRGRVYINQTPVPLATLRALGEHLIDFHGQHEHQSLLRPNVAREITDRLEGVREQLERYERAYGAYLETSQSLEEHERRMADLNRRRDLLEFQLDELGKLAPKKGEEEKLAEEFRKLSSVAERLASVSRISALLENEGEGPALDRLLSMIRKELEALHRLDSSAEPWIRDLDSAQTYFSELSRFCGTYLDHEGAGRNETGDLDTINDRLARIQRLKKKYSCTGDELVDVLERVRAELQDLANTNSDREILRRNKDEAEKSCVASGRELRRARQKAAKKFDHEVAAKMGQLGFADNGWTTDFKEANHPGPHGLDEVSFQVRTNPGEPYRPLARIASGGEISRIMLAIKSVLADRDEIPVLIFDEIDTGIGGMLARNVADTMKQLSESHQVLCISHLHQIASRADQHVLVRKELEQNRTVTRIRPLTQEERVNEIARMLGADSETSRKHARELLGEKT
jgi:DNA repair protein RecN (Recombination protein N)